MAFLGVYRAIYNFDASTDHELTVKDGDLLFVLEKGEDGWWKAKRKADAVGEDEHEGLVPAAYIEEAESINQARALYDYERQTDEELSFTEETNLVVYDVSDPDWTLVGCKGSFGFVPSNYIVVDEEQPPPKPARPAIPTTPTTTQSNHSAAPPSPPADARPSAATAIASIINEQKTGSSSPRASRSVSSPRAAQFTPEASDEDEGPAPSLPQRPTSQVASPPRIPKPQVASPPPEPEFRGEPTSPTSYRMYHIHEMVSHQGKNRKMPTTLGINLAKGIILIAPEKSSDGSQNEWSAEKMTHYSLEGKHVFIELVRPSKSIDFHAGAKETAKEIVAQLGELAGASRAEGFREVISAASGSGQKRGVMLYEFMAQGDDEVTVAIGDEVIIIDDRQSEEWWNVRRLKNGKEGVVPSSYVEITGTTTPSADIPSAMSSREQNRIEEERQTREAIRASQKEAKAQEKKRRERTHSKSESGGGSASGAKSKPNPNKVRTWTDRSGGFKVEAEFLGLKESKIHLHKLNGVKIAVPVGKMSLEDIEVVEKITGESLDEEKPLAEIKRRSTQQRRSKDQSHDQSSSNRGKAGAAIEPPQKPQYDWFDFFLQCGVNPQICERYASTFSKDQMGEENMEDINPTLLRTLGLKEGDILRVMKHLDNRYGRQRSASTSAAAAETNGESGGLFSGPGGTLRNNTRKGRPAPAVATNDTVDPRAFEQDSIRKEPRPDSPASDHPPTPPPKPSGRGGFEDNAWEVKPSKARASSAATQPTVASAPAPAPRPAPPPTGAMAELSLLSEPLKPTPALQPVQVQQQQQQQPQVQQPAQSPTASVQPNVANAQFFNQLAQTPTGLPSQTISAPRQRPQPPTQQYSSQSALLSPPPTARPMSAPNNNQPSAFGPPPPLQAQTTGYAQQGRPAPPGQSMAEINQQRIQQQQFQQFQPQPTGYGFNQGMNGMPMQQQQQPQQGFGYGQFQQPQQTGFQAPIQPQFLQSQPTGSPFADPPQQQFQSMQPQQTGFQQPYMPQNQFQSQPTGINSFLPPALAPQPTGAVNGFSVGQPQSAFGQQPAPQMPSQQPQSAFGQQPAPQMPPMPSQLPQIAPLQQQKTGPAPPVRFGVTDAPKLTPQLTGRRANLSQATPQNPFGF